MTEIWKKKHAEINTRATWRTSSRIVHCMELVKNHFFLFFRIFINFEHLTHWPNACYYSELFKCNGVSRTHWCNPCINLCLDSDGETHALIFYWAITARTKGDSLVLTVTPHKLQTIGGQWLAALLIRSYDAFHVSHDLQRNIHISKWSESTNVESRKNRIDWPVNRVALLLRVPVFLMPRARWTEKWNRIEILVGRRKVHAQHSRSFDSLLTHKQCSDRRREYDVTSIGTMNVSPLERVQQTEQNRRLSQRRHLFDSSVRASKIDKCLQLVPYAFGLVHFWVQIKSAISWWATSVFARWIACNLCHGDSNRFFFSILFSASPWFGCYFFASSACRNLIIYSVKYVSALPGAFSEFIIINKEVWNEWKSRVSFLFSRVLPIQEKKSATTFIGIHIHIHTRLCWW